MRNYKHFDDYLDELRNDIYIQPPDEGHTAWAEKVINRWVPKMACRTVLDVGCGYAFCQPMFEKLGLVYTGVTLGSDYYEARKLDRNVLERDFSFLDDFEDDTFDLIFSRHSLEHSPFPILTLMEWSRVGKRLILILPRPSYWKWGGKNHYSVMEDDQVRFLLERADWVSTEEDMSDEREFRYLCRRAY